MASLEEGHNLYRQSTETINSLFYAMNELQTIGLTAVYNPINLNKNENVIIQKVMQTNLNNLVYKHARYTTTNLLIC